MIQALILIAETIAMGVVLLHSVCALNHMNRATRPAIMAAVVFVFVGAFSRAYLLVIGAADPSFISAMLEAGIAMGMLANQRRSIHCPCLPAWSHAAKGNDKEHPA